MKKENKKSFKSPENKKVLIIAISATVVIAVITFVILIYSDKVIDNSYKSEYITAESDITMMTAAEGETEVSTDEYGNDFIIGSDGVYRKSSFGDTYEKIMNQKIVPLVGEWHSNDTATAYQFFNDGSFLISVPYEAADGSIQHARYMGMVEVREKYTDALSAFKFGSMDALFRYMSIDSKSFVKENLYYLKLQYDTVSSTETLETYSFSEVNSESQFEEAVFDGLMYTYWLQDIDSYKMKVSSVNSDETYTFTKQDL